MKKVLKFTIIIIISSLNANALVTKSILDFGGKGDGLSNNYNAFLSAAAYFNKIGGGILNIPKGVYYVKNYHAASLKSSDVKFANLNNFKVIGSGAKIVLNAGFVQNADWSHNGFSYSKTSTIVPFHFENCTNLSVSGIEIDGGVNNAKKNSNVVEGGSFLLFLINCKNVLLKDLYLHHGLNDGLYIDGERSYNYNVENVICSNNARQGMSIVCLNKGTFKNSKFINTGINNGYGYHAPGAGVDIETEKVNDRVKNILFINCSFENNIGSQLVMSNPDRVSSITLDGCTINGLKSKSPYQIITAGKNVLIKNSDIDCAHGAIYVNWLASPGCSVTLYNNNIKSRSFGIMSSGGSSDENIIIDNNRITYTGDKEVESYFPYIQKWNLIFTNNTVIIPKSKQKKGDGLLVNSLIQNVKISSGNKYYDEKGSSFLQTVSFMNALTVNDK